MSYIEGYGDNYSGDKIPYDEIPISRKAQKKKRQRVSVSNFNILVSIVAVMFIINIGLCIALIYHVKHAVVKNVIVNHNNISVVGDSSVWAVETAESSSVCIAAGGTCYDKNTFFKNTASRGSGVIYKIDETNDEIYYITCHHVVDGYDKYYVLLPGEQIERATLVGYSAYYDIAVLKTDADNADIATGIQVFDSTFLTTGEEVYAVGNPLSGGPSVTKGIISRINTLINVEGNNFQSREIQIDAAINPGNSGGGAYNNEGKFIGLVNAKLNSAQSGNSSISVAGTAYAIPSRLVISIADNIISSSGAPTCVNLGVQLEHNPDFAFEKYEFEDNKFIKDYKVQIESVKSGSIAEGKLYNNDEILSVKFTDLFGKTQEITMFNMYSFEDIKFIVKPYSTITFTVNREFKGEVTVNIDASSFSTY